MRMHWLLMATFVLIALTAKSFALSSQKVFPRKEVAMAVNNGIITAPIADKDPYTCMGVGKYNGWYDIGYACSNNHGKINMWSRFKPVRWRSVDINMTNPEWWKAEDGRCGIDFTDARMSTYTQTPSKMTSDKLNGWKYLPPNGNVFPFRLLDFNKYMHFAFPPVGSFNVPEKAPYGGNFVASMGLSMITTEKDEPGSISLGDIRDDSTQDIHNLGEYHLGIYVTDTSGNKIGRVIGGSGANNLQVTYSVIGLPLGNTYNVYPFFAKEKRGQFDADVANIYYTIPTAVVKQVRIVSKEEAEGLSISITARYIYDLSDRKTSVLYTLEVTSKSSRTFTNNTIALRFENNEPMDPLEAGEVQKKLSDINVSSGNPYELTDSIIIRYYDRSYYLYLSLDSGVYTRRINILEINVPEM